MNPSQAWLLTALILTVGGVTAAHATDIYKCTINGATAYRDQPCSADKPEAGRWSKPSSQHELAPVAIGDSPAALMSGLRRLSERERQLRAQQHRELEQLRVRMAGVHDDQAVQRNVAEFKRSWQQRFAENDRQKQDALDRLRRLCPGGASSRSGRATCNKRSR